MKVAVCISGAFKSGHPKGCLIKNNKIRKLKFPEADFYYATWESYKSEFKKHFPEEHCEYFPEPNMHYHPYLDIKKKDHISKYYQDIIIWMKKGGTKRLKWSSHHTKQILIHTWLSDKIKNKYDVIIRTRFDGFISEKANFDQYIVDTYENNRANCFSATKQKLFDELNQFDSSPGKKQSQWLCDQLIIHPAQSINREHVDQLHHNKKLHAAETGWYQVISMPYGSNHRDFDGWANHDRNVLDEFLFGQYKEINHEGK